MKSSNQWVTPKYYTFIFLFVFQTFPNVLIKRILFFVFSVAITAITKLHLTRNKMRSQAQSCEIIFSKCMCAYCIMCSTARIYMYIYVYLFVQNENVTLHLNVQHNKCLPISDFFDSQSTQLLFWPHLFSFHIPSKSRIFHVFSSSKIEN